MIGTIQSGQEDILWRVPSYLGTHTESGDLSEVSEEVLKARWYKNNPRAAASVDTLASFLSYGRIASQLDQLMSATEEDEFGKVRPSTVATAGAKSLLFHLAERQKIIEPEDVSTDRDGGLRISWRKGARFLELILPYETDLQPYIYFSEKADFGVHHDIKTDQLRGWMSWVEGLSRPE
jgi:hypothetical protein